MPRFDCDDTMLPFRESGFFLASTIWRKSDSEMTTDLNNIFLSRADLNSLAEPVSRLEPAYKPVYDAWKQSDTDESRNAVLHAMTPLIDRTVKSVAGSDPNYMRIRAKLLVLNSLPKYDPKHSALETYMTHQLMPLRRTARQQMNILGLPDRMLVAATQLDGAELELSDELGRPPTTLELSDKMHISPKQIERLRRMTHARNTGSYAVADEEGQVGGAGAVSRNLSEQYRHQFVLSALQRDPKSALIYEHDNGLHGRAAISTADLAKKLGLSAGAISQRRNKIAEVVNNAEREIYG